MTKRGPFKFTLAATGVLLLAAVTFVLISEFLVFQTQAREILRRLPAEERELPQNVKQLFSRLEERELNIWVARNLLQDCAPHTGMARWNVRFSLWIFLVPRFYSREERESLFAHYLLAKGAQGLKQVSIITFGKPPHMLSPDETVGLLVVTKAPGRNSPATNPERYRKVLEEMKRKYGAV